jgi:hypothetical protein
VLDPADSDHRNIERFLGSDTRFGIRVGSRACASTTSTTGITVSGATAYSRTRRSKLRNDLDEAAGRL